MKNTDSRHLSCKHLFLLALYIYIYIYIYIYPSPFWPLSPPLLLAAHTVMGVLTAPTAVDIGPKLGRAAFAAGTPYQLIISTANQARYDGTLFLVPSHPQPDPPLYCANICCGGFFCTDMNGRFWKILSMFFSVLFHQWHSQLFGNVCAAPTSFVVF